MSPERRAIIIAPWGFPPQWGIATYKFRFNRKGLNIPDFECLACNSTLALASALMKSNLVSIERIIVIGLDSVIPPKEDTSNHREEVRKWFYKAIRDLINGCECCENISESLFEVVIAPGIGKYHGYSFEGTANHIFITTYKSILNLLKSNENKIKERDVFLDITHGINYQVTAVLYATIAALLSYNPKERTEERLYIVNSEPYPPGYRTKKCVIGERPQIMEGMPAMEILDFTELHNAIRALRAITNMIKLDERLLERYVISLKRQGRLDNDVSEISNKLGELIKFFKLLRLGLAGLVYPYNNFRLNSRRINEDIQALYQQYRGVVNKEYDPRLNHAEKTVNYERVNMYVVVVEILEQIRKLIIQPLANARDIVEFKTKLKEIYNKSNMINNTLLVEKEITDFKQLLKLLEEKFPSANKIWKQDQIELIWCAIKGMRYKIQEEERVERGIGDTQLRNFLAHIGLNHEIISEIKIVNGREEISFKNELLDKYLSRIY